FTFSSPTLKIKLAQGGAADPAKVAVKEEVPPVPEKPAPKEEVAATTTKAAAPAEVKKVITKSISCVKGKVTRKISGTNPICPAGFKKK
ncbi:MAG: hypothetical protein WCI68_06300, partial [Actinomycetes bacterium]